MKKQYGAFGSFIRFGLIVLGLAINPGIADGEAQTDGIKPEAFSIEYIYKNTGIKKRVPQSTCLGVILNGEAQQKALNVSMDLLSEYPDIPLVLKDEEGNSLGNLSRMDAVDGQFDDSKKYDFYFDQLPPVGCTKVYLSGSLPVILAEPEQKSMKGTLRLRENETVQIGDILLTVETLGSENFPLSELSVKMLEKDYKLAAIELRNKKGELIHDVDQEVVWGSDYTSLRDRLSKNTSACYNLKEFPEEVDVTIKYHDTVSMDIPINLVFNSISGISIDDQKAKPSNKEEGSHRMVTDGGDRSTVSLEPYSIRINYRDYELKKGRGVRVFRKGVTVALLADINGKGVVKVWEGMPLPEQLRLSSCTDDKRTDSTAGDERRCSDFWLESSRDRSSKPVYYVHFDEPFSGETAYYQLTGDFPVYVQQDEQEETEKYAMELKKGARLTNELFDLKIADITEAKDWRGDDKYQISYICNWKSKRDGFEKIQIVNMENKNIVAPGFYSSGGMGDIYRISHMLNEQPDQIKCSILYKKSKEKVISLKTPLIFGLR